MRLMSSIGLMMSLSLATGNTYSQHNIKHPTLPVTRVQGLVVHWVTAYHTDLKAVQCLGTCDCRCIHVFHLCYFIANGTIISMAMVSHALL